MTIYAHEVNANIEDLHFEISIGIMIA